MSSLFRLPLEFGDVVFENIFFSRRLMPLLRTDDLVSQCPIIGIWLRGVSVSGSHESGFKGPGKLCNIGVLEVRLAFMSQVWF